MKKRYNTPTTKIVDINAESILAGSTVGVYGDANENNAVLSKRTGSDMWDDDDECDEY